MLRSRAILCSLMLSTAVVGCDSDDSEPSDEMTSAGGTTTTDPPSTTADPTASEGEGRCAMDMAVLTCEQGDCAFEAAEVECAAACANIAAVCASDACGEECTGLESEATLCTAACEGSKNLLCSNVVFGCYATNSTCNDVGTCVETNK